MTVLGLWFVSRSQSKDSGTPALPTRLKTLVTATWALTFVQFFLGALTRHMDAWGVSVTFPQWNSEGFFPDAQLFQYGQVVVHFAHRTTAYIVAVFVLWQWLSARRVVQAGLLQRTTVTAAALVGVQILLGAAILWTARGEVVTTLHVMVGVGLLALNTVSLYIVNSRPSRKATVPIGSERFGSASVPFRISSVRQHP